MDKITSWCEFIALISMLSSVMFLILPEGKINKAFKLLLSFIMFYSFILPLSEAEIDFSHIADYFDFSENTSSSEILESYENYPLISAAEMETEEYFNGLISDIGAEGYCEAVCDIESDRIILRQIHIFAEADESQKTMIAEGVKKIYGEETTIIFSGEQ